jgi:hypothetical protein
MMGLFLFATAPRTALGPTQLPIQWVTGDLPLGVKQPEREADHSPPYSAEVKNEWSYTSSPPIRLNGMMLNLKIIETTLLYFTLLYFILLYYTLLCFALLYRVQTGSGAHPATYSLGTGDFFPGDNAAST